ncbi:hypothetical protein [Bartonella sp. DGB1]|uniref:hypothetical protein n=1 Tax=Bartonella sp. DGB1 TaxID=3239807 RepID=UPI0035252392
MKKLKYLIIGLSFLTVVTPAFAELPPLLKDQIPLWHWCLYDAIPAEKFQTFEECMDHFST